MKKTLLLLTIILSFWGCNKTEDEPIALETTPTVRTSEITEISKTNAISGGSITSDGGSNIVQKGVCWGKNPNPTTVITISSGVSLNGNGNQPFTSELKELQPNTIYYVRAFATNSKGTGYGNEYSFTTENDTPPLNTFNGDIELKSQAEVDSFGAHQYNHINGDILIYPHPYESISNLEALSSITTIQGSLSILGSDLVNLKGLNNLNSLSGGLYIYNVYKLISLSELESLSSVSAAIIIAETNLEDINLSNLTSVGAFTIRDNHRIEHINDYSSLTSVEALIIDNNHNLIDIDGFSNLTEIPYFLSISDNTKLINIDGLIGLTSVNNLSISQNNSLSNVDGLSNLTSVGDFIEYSGECSLSNNYNLNNLDGLSSLTSIRGDLILARNSILNNLSGLSNLSAVGGIRIRNNDNLTSLTGLSSISSIEASIVVFDNLNLSDLCDLQPIIQNGFSGLYTVTGNKYNPTQQDIIDNRCSDSQIDTDGDGVMDADDNCADTPSGEDVDANGCCPSDLAKTYDVVLHYTNAISGIDAWYEFQDTFTETGVREYRTSEVSHWIGGLGVGVAGMTILDDCGSITIPKQSLFNYYIDEVEGSGYIDGDTGIIYLDYDICKDGECRVYSAVYTPVN